MSSNTEQLLAKLKSEFLNSGETVTAEPTLAASKRQFMDLSAMEDMRTIQHMRAFYAEDGRRNPYFMPRQGRINDRLQVQGQDYISYSGYNYLGLSHDQRVIGAAQQALARYGTHAGAARMVGGEMELHRELEQTLAEAFGFEDCVASVGGYVVNVMTVGYLLGGKDLLLMDEYMHNSGVMGGVTMPPSNGCWRPTATVISGR
jgi:7-keto-8-aminopelargonate synthetase-like enzyme